MRFNIASLASVSILLASQAEAGVITGWVKRQATCKECPLNPGNVVKQIVSLFTDTQSNDNCRWEATFGLPKDLGGPEKPSYDHRIRVNYNEVDNTCSVETVNRVEAMGDDIFCIAGGCGVKDITETHATVAWGACVIKDTVNFVPGQTMGERECVDAQGEIRFKRFHDTDHCDGSGMLTSHVGGQDQRDFPASQRKGGMFWGGIVTACSAMAVSS